MGGQGKAVLRRAARGIFAGKTTKFGNNVSEDGGNRTRRSWKPNVQRKRVFSETLGFVKVPVTAHALRCIDRAGGLDDYLRSTSDAKLGPGVALGLKRSVLAKPAAPSLTDRLKAAGAFLPEAAAAAAAASKQ
mmetsp:Transcript_28470/g.93013  ORF Transcript_28470/g.93013 Transcript_28470/m.93013 type:complete len:133 (-) Transcript_28470:96-494(-)